MNEKEFLDKWREEKPIYAAWGSFVKEKINSKLDRAGINLDVFLKVPANPRLKEDKSLVDKAFYRANKYYKDPYVDIEDKVGLRFVVLLLEDIDLVCSVIKECAHWNFDECKHFYEERRKEPLLFTYQSVHFILTPREELSIGSMKIPVNIPCEVQIRTLLQHAHAELTHDTIYKSKKTIQPEVHRTVAKSMALIETTDDFFKEVSLRLTRGPLEELGVAQRLSGIYRSLTGQLPANQKSSIVIWDEFEDLITEDLAGLIEEFLKNNSYLGKKIVERYMENGLYQQSVVLFIYWMLKKKRGRFLRDWPLERSFLEPLATDLGISLERY
jgi:ppGpp synthetase/RelA/SpoT-type nucleotidyltranferase